MVTKKFSHFIEFFGLVWLVLPTERFVEETKNLVDSANLAGHMVAKLFFFCVCVNILFYSIYCI